MILLNGARTAARPYRRSVRRFYCGSFVDTLESPYGGSMEALHTLEMKGISKSFHGHYANKNIDFSIRAGEIVGLLGENGAGKTTLMNILYGLYRPDSGMILINGKPTVLKSPKDALQAGIGMVHQHFMLVQNHSVIENIAAAYKDCPQFLPLAHVRKKLDEFVKTYGFEIKADEKVYNLAAGELQRIEIVKALLNGASLLILDEPTSVLSPQEAEELFVVLRKMAQEGHAVIIISHKLDEILSLCHRVVVLRKGEISGACDTAVADKTELARMMVGRDIEFHSERKKLQPGACILEVKNIHVSGDRGERAVDGVSFCVHQFEIFGIAGVSGNGQRELAEAITGLREVQSGTIMLDGENVTNLAVKTLSAKGMAHIPEERMRFGIVPNLFLFENAILKDYHTEDFSDDLFLKYPSIKKFAEMIVKKFKVSTPSIHAPLKHLSGGNIQKLILGREISGDPSLLVAAHPTYGLDVGATEYIRSQLLKRRERGGAILLLSEDLEEILELSDRIGVMFKGKFMGIVEREKADLTDIGLMMGGVLPERKEGM